MKLMIGLPAFNEAATIAGVIQAIPRTMPGVSELKVIVFDDGSTDSTAEQAVTVGAQIYSFPFRVGLSRVFRRMVHEALERAVDVLVTIDADGQFNALDIPRLLEPIHAQQAECVTASRFIDPSITPAMPSLKRWGNRQVARMISLVTGQQLTDVSCGFRAYSREALLHLNLFSGYTYTHETILNLLFKEQRVIEVPVVVKGQRQFGQSKVAHNLWRYGYNMLTTIFRTVLDYKPLKFFGWTGVIIFLLGLAADVFVGGRLLLVGAVTPFKTLGFVGLAFNIFGLLLFIVGLLADIINRARQTQERQLYLQKKHTYRHL